MNKDAQHLRPVADVIEANSAEFRKRALDHPADLSVWTKLYTASQTMLSAMREGRVDAALVEISSNLLGCEDLAVVEIARETGVVEFLITEGLSTEKRDALIHRARFLDSCIELGKASIAVDRGKNQDALASIGVSALVPLWADERSSGAMVLFQLLPQRSGFDAEDREVLQLLSLYAGQCLRSQTRV